MTRGSNPLDRNATSSLPQPCSQLLVYELHKQLVQGFSTFL